MAYLQSNKLEIMTPRSSTHYYSEDAVRPQSVGDGKEGDKKSQGKSSPNEDRRALDGPGPLGPQEENGGQENQGQYIHDNVNQGLRENCRKQRASF